jgi:hypothetical protein
MIPKTFRLGGRRWTVKRNCKSPALGRKNSWYGRTHFSQCRIELSQLNRDAEEEGHTFLHELLHAIASTMGWEKLNKDEHKIDAVAGLLLQALTTADEEL